VSTLRVSDRLSLPAEEAVTRSFGILGMRGSGKSNAAVVMAEEMFAAGLHWVAIDPKGDWWGIRSSADGKGAGLPVVIFGGEHGDVPLEPTSRAGVLVADTILNEGITCILDLSEFSKGQKVKFLAGEFADEGFAGRLFRKKKREQDPIHVFLEEAHDYVPQQARGELGKLIDVVSQLQTMGRTRGLGCSVLSQRSARVHKDVLTQVDTLIAFRTISPQDRGAVEDWIKGHGLAREMIDSLPSLANGESWVWSPEWLGSLERVQWRRRTTHDSGSTPVSGTLTRRPATLADVNLDALNEAMAATFERAKADDPKALRARVRDLERQLSERPTETKVETVTERVEVPVLAPSEIDRLEALVGNIEALGGRLHDLAGEMRMEMRRAGGSPIDSRPVPRPTPQPRPVAISPARTPAPRVAVSDDGRPLAKAERAILSVLAQFPSRTKKQVALLTGYAMGGGGFNNALGSLRSRGYIEGREDISATDAGQAAVEGQWEPLPTGPALLDHWLGQLSKAERMILSALADAYPDGLTKEDLGARTGYEPSGGGFNNALGRLRTLELVERGPTPRLSEELGEAVNV
jgi:uncharacterized protein